MKKDKHRSTTLLLTIPTIWHPMMEIGGDKLVRITSNDGYTILHNMCYWVVSPQLLILEVIDIGKKKMVTSKWNDERTPLYYLLLKYKDETYMKVFHKLLEVGGAEILNFYRETLLYIHFSKDNPSLEILKALIQALGADNLTLLTNKIPSNWTPLHSLCYFCKYYKAFLKEIITTVEDKDFDDTLIKLKDNIQLVSPRRSVPKT